MLTINREQSERKKNREKIAFGAYKIIGPRPLGGWGAGRAPLDPLV